MGLLQDNNTASKFDKFLPQNMQMIYYARKKFFGVESCFYARAKFGVSYATTVLAMTSLMYWPILLEPCLSYLM